MTEDEQADANVCRIVEGVLAEKVRVIGDSDASEDEWRGAYGAFAALKVVLRLGDGGCKDGEPCYCALIARVQGGNGSAAPQAFEALVATARSRAQSGAYAGLRRQLEVRRDEAQAVDDGVGDTWSAGVAGAYRGVLDLIEAGKPMTPKSNEVGGSGLRSRSAGTGSTEAAS